VFRVERSHSICEQAALVNQGHADMSSHSIHLDVAEMGSRSFENDRGSNQRGHDPIDLDFWKLGQSRKKQYTLRESDFGGTSH
jgi:hypothetical protein